MPRLPQPRSGATLEVSGRRLPFSFFPVTRTARRYGLYDTVFAASPWAVMQGSINASLASGEQAEASAFLEQAEHFYEAAITGVSTNPLLLYYAYLNLAKALLRVRGYTGSLDRAMHGLSESVLSGGVELSDSRVTVKDSGGSNGPLSVYSELIGRLGYSRPTHGSTYPVLELLPQIVIGHRIWREARTGNAERFFDLKEIEIVNSAHLSNYGCGSTSTVVIYSGTGFLIRG